MATRRNKPDYRSYPREDGYRSGCKVAWYQYWSKADAENAAIAARHNAAIQASYGYDFGYCCPGSITKLDNGMFEVCIP